jgi:hypothetical protein
MRPKGKHGIPAEIIQTSFRGTCDFAKIFLRYRKVLCLNREHVVYIKETYFLPILYAGK